MGKLTNSTSAPSNGGKQLTRGTGKPFKIAICEQLDNDFCFKKLKPSDLKEFHNFIDETVEKKLTISQVDALFLRKKGDIKQDINGREVFHYGKDRKPFRVFGYYNEDGYFNVTRIDPKHKTNKG